MTKVNIPFLYSYISREEEVLWYGKPNKTCVILESIFNPFLAFALFWGLIDLTILSGFILHNFNSINIIVPIILFFSIHMMPVWIYLFGVFFSIKKSKNMEFLVTDKAIYIAGGTFKREVNIKRYEQIYDISVRRGFFDKKLGVGDIIFEKLGIPYSVQRRNSFKIENIRDYLYVYKLIKKAHADFMERKKMNDSNYNTQSNGGDDDRKVDF